MEAADDGMYLVDAGHFLRVTDGIDHAGVAAGRDHHEPPVFHVHDGGVLALKVVGDQLPGLGLDLDEPEVRRRASRAS